MKFPAWSYSSLTSFETCPKRHYHLKVAKDVREEVVDATVWGKEVHKHLEQRLKDQTPLPVSIEGYERLVAPIAAAPGEKLVEKQFAVTSSFKPTGWWDKDVWCRGVVDVGVLTGKKAVLLDWKTGKRKTENDQLKLFAALAFSHYEQLETTVTGFVWLKTDQIDKATYERSQATHIWGEFAPRVIRMQKAFEEEKFPPKPSGLCSKWCPVPRSKCQYSGKAK